MSIEKYHRFARECLEIAAETSSTELHYAMLKMARALLELAMADAGDVNPFKPVERSEVKLHAPELRI